MLNGFSQLLNLTNLELITQGLEIVFSDMQNLIK
jgi:hypothetical protein